MPTKVILDVDTGTDDAVALMVAALSPDIELVGATTVNGNTTIDFTTENTCASSTGSGCRRSRSTGVWTGRSSGRRSNAAWPTRIHGDMLDLPAVSNGAKLSRATPSTG